MNQKQHGFTLIELVVVIVILGMIYLCGILMQIGVFEKKDN